LDTREVTVAPSSTLALQSVSRRFGTVQALDKVCFSITPGYVHAVLGENGAGKSTAIRILAGLDTPDSGTVEFSGAPVRLRSRADAIRRGIGLVPQSDSLAGELDLVENLMFSMPWQLLRRRHAAMQLRAAAEAAGVTMNMGVPVRNLSRGQRQLGELILALAEGARVLLLDEPTSALGTHEIGDLFTRVRALAEAGVGILFVTHRLAEVRAIADTATVLSHGHVAWHGSVDEVDDATLVATMVGDVPAPQDRPARVLGPVALSLERVTADCGDQVPIRDVSLAVRAGEVVGVIGIAGNGQRALAEAAAGCARPTSGTVTADGQRVAYVPESRLDGLLPHRAAKWSAVVARLRERRFAKFGVVAERMVTEFSAGLLARHDVRPPAPETHVTMLSGGNQQKLLVGRELDCMPTVAVFHGPTQGLDMKAARAIRDEIAIAAAAGAAVLLVSADLEEVHGLADRLIVLSGGRVVGEFTSEHFDEAVVRRLTAGLPAESLRTGVESEAG
jgi:general nucleoside transport system ATP-binding protein